MSLTSLPPDILARIASHILKQADLNSLAQTNHQLHTVANPLLYTRKDSDKRGEILVLAIQQSNIKLCKLVLRDGANTALRVRREYGKTPLILAAINGETEITRLLLAHKGIDPDIRDDFNQSPLSHASGKGHEAIVRLLLSTPGVDLDSCSSRGQGPIQRAALYGFTSIVEMLIATGRVEIDRLDHQNQTPFWVAAHGGHYNVARLLLSHGVNPDPRDLSGQTALMVAATAGSEEIVRDLLILARQGLVDVNVRDYMKQTILHGPAVRGHAGVVRQLLDFGVDPDPVDDWQNTPLMLAAQWSSARRGDYEGVIRALLGTGEVQLHARNRDGKTALMLVEKKGPANIVALLKEAEETGSCPMLL